MKDFLRKAVEHLDVGYFSFVMATGIVSIAAYRHAMETVAYALFVLNNCSYAVLIALTAARAVSFRQKMLLQAASPATGPALFTITAATCILGTQYVVFSNALSVATALWLGGTLFWAVLIYSFFAAVIVSPDKRSFAETLNGGWMIYVVGTQALSIIAIYLAAAQPDHAGYMLFAAGLHTAGILLYVVLITIILHRMLFLPMVPASFTQHYWINMGAAAISCLAGAEIALHAGLWPFLRDSLPVIRWMTFALWAITTWWIPLVVLLVAWRYLIRRFPIKYGVEHWSMIFPLGMYSVCSFELNRIAPLPAVAALSEAFAYIALLAWTAAFVGLIAGLVRKTP